MTTAAAAISAAVKSAELTGADHFYTRIKTTPWSDLTMAEADAFLRKSESKVAQKITITRVDGKEPTHSEPTPMSTEEQAASRKEPGIAIVGIRAHSCSDRSDGKWSITHGYSEDVLGIITRQLTEVYKEIGVSNDVRTTGAMVMRVVYPNPKHTPEEETRALIQSQKWVKRLLLS